MRTKKTYGIGAVLVGAYILYAIWQIANNFWHYEILDVLIVAVFLTLIVRLEIWLVKKCRDNTVESSLHRGGLSRKIGFGFAGMFAIGVIFLIVTAAMEYTGSDAAGDVQGQQNSNEYQTEGLVNVNQFSNITPEELKLANKSQAFYTSFNKDLVRKKGTL